MKPVFMSRRLPLSLPLFLLCCLSSCATPLPQGEILLAPETRFQLPTPSSLGRNIDVAQLVTAQAMGQSLMLEARISVKGDELLLIGTDPAGRRAITIKQTKEYIEASRADWVPSNINASNILADIMLVYWPKDALIKALPESVTLEESSSTRNFIRNGQLLVSIDYSKRGWQGRATLTNHSWGYKIQITSAEVRS